MNEFFTCPNYLYGLFLITLISIICTVVIKSQYEDRSETANSLSILSQIITAGLCAWTVWGVLNMFKKHPSCQTKFGPTSNPLNPFASVIMEE
jgi:hypothetical protein